MSVSLTDIIAGIGAFAACVTALFIFLTWYDSRRERRDKVLVTRFVEGGRWYIRVTSKKDNVIEDCEVSFAGETLVDKKPPNAKKVLIVSGSQENFMFSAANPPAPHDTRNIVTTERGNRIFKRSVLSKRRFDELHTDPS